MSLIFYAWGEPKWIVLMLISTGVEYFGALLVERYREERPAIAKLSLGVSVTVALSFLFIFKYFDFFTFNFNQTFGTDIKLLGLTLPIGISFYTFQTITYIVDVYRKKAEVQRSYWNLLLYVSMFPQLIAGPIVKYVDVEKQLTSRTYNGRKAGDGVFRFLIGLTKKAIFANIAGEMATQFLDGDFSELSVLGAWIGILSYTLQIYFDFSAYSDMAIGLGKIFGFDYPENFNYPYIAKSVSEFWKRWHISLNTWFVDYVYIPLGGSREGRWKTIRNTFVIFLLSGLWHGANWTYVTWGLYHALLFVPLILIGRTKAYSGVATWKQIPQILLTFALVVLGWIIFRAPSIADAWGYICGMWQFGTAHCVHRFFTQEGLTPSNWAIIIMIVIEWFNRAKKHTFDIHFIKYWWLRIIIYYMLIIVIWRYSAGEQTFIYFQF